MLSLLFFFFRLCLNNLFTIEKLFTFSKKKLHQLQHTLGAERAASRPFNRRSAARHCEIRPPV
jgi:hypothetical protein